MSIFFDLKTLSGDRFRGWMAFKTIRDGLITIERKDRSEVTVPLPQMAYLEELPEGHPRIPAWAVDQLGKTAEVQV